jgi:hypothetical protein
MAAHDGSKGLRFTIRQPDGRVERLMVDAEAALVGSGAHCEIRIGGAAHEQLLVTMAGEAVHVDVRSIDPMPLLDGHPFRQANVRPESLLAIGAVQLLVEVRDLDGEKNVVKAKGEAFSPLTWVALALAVPLAGYVLFGDELRARRELVPEGAPELFDAPVATCRHSSADEALAAAFDALALARGKRERSPFAVQDGVAAVPLFERASACFAQGGQGELAADASAAAKDLRARLADDYRVHRVRLEHAVDMRDDKSALKEVRVLRSLTEGKGGPWVEWLASVERRLTMKLGRKA